MSVEWRAICEAKKEIPVPMSQYEELLEEFETYGRSADGVKSVILMQYISERLHEGMTRYNWVGFYLMEVPAFKALVLGPYVGSFMPTLRIPLDKGLCGAAATSGETVVVNNVRADPRYLGSDLVKSNIVVPIFVKNEAGGRVGYRKLLCGYLHCTRAEIHRVLRRPGRPVYGKKGVSSGGKFGHFELGGTGHRGSPARLLLSVSRLDGIHTLKSAAPFHTNCTAIARIRNPKMRLIAPMAPGPRRFTNGPPRHSNR